MARRARRAPSGASDVISAPQPIDAFNPGDAPLMGAPTPRYYRVLVAIEKWIRDGLYNAGDQLPTEAELCRSFQVSRITVRHALDELRRAGRLMRRQGRGTFVAPGMRPRPVPLNWSDLMTQVIDLSQSTETRDLRVKLVTADADTRAALRLPGSARVRRVTHIGLLGGEPLGVITSWVPEDIAQRIPAEEFTRALTLTLLARDGMRVGESRQAIGASLANASLARRLGITPGAALVRLERVVFDDSGRGVERVLALYRADRYQYRMTLNQSTGLR